MLRTDREGQAWLVTQPHHAEVAGYLAAHWGNREFARPGHFAPTPDPERLRAETVFGIAQHDNGWWEWDAAPRLREADGLPLGLAEVFRNQREGMTGGGSACPASARRTLTPPCSSAFTPCGSTRPESALGRTRPSATRYTQGPRRLSWPGRRPRRPARSSPSSGGAVGAEGPDRGGPGPRRLARAGAARPARPPAATPRRAIAVAVRRRNPAAGGEARGLGEDAFDLPEVPRRGRADRVRVSLRPSGGGRIAAGPTRST